MNDTEKPASFKQRATAFAIDAVLNLIVLYILLAIIGIVEWYFRGGGTLTYEVETYYPGGWYGYLLIFVAAFFLYSVLTNFFWNGQTIGKNIIKIRVKSHGAKKITLGTSIKRAFGLIVSGLQCGYSVYRYYKFNDTPVQDRLADTHVVDEPVPPPEPPPKEKKPKKKKRRRSMLR
ncbi:MAG: hypothetical protein GF315_10050 [candidate division Zixibacteria bacterium]|nr:hypothetical protein [candidate division Zixibacteria bacterium]